MRQLSIFEWTVFFICVKSVVRLSTHFRAAGLSQYIVSVVKIGGRDYHTVRNLQCEFLYSY